MRNDLHQKEKTQFGEGSEFFWRMFHVQVNLLHTTGKVIKFRDASQG